MLRELMKMATEDKNSGKSPRQMGEQDFNITVDDGQVTCDNLLTKQASATTKGSSDELSKASACTTADDVVYGEDDSLSSNAVQQSVESEIEELIRVLDSDASKDVKLEALRRIDEYAKTRTDIQIDLDEDPSDAESESSDSFADIPLPNAGNLLFPDGIPLPSESLRPLDHIPLPHPASSAAAQAAVNILSHTATSFDLPDVCAKSTADIVLNDEKSSVRTPVSANSGLRSATSSDTNAAVLAKTTLGTITVHLKGKAGTKLSKSSVFDLTDENAKEVNRKLARLRKLKRSRKSKDGGEQTAGDGAPTTAEKRIQEWKEELMKEQGQRRGRLVVSETLDTGKQSGLPKISEKDRDESSGTNTTTASNEQGCANAAAMSRCSLESSACEDSTLAVNSQNAHTPVDEAFNKLLESFVKVRSKDDLNELDWPTEMTKSTELMPKLVFSCNPLYFNFKQFNGALDSKESNVRNIDKSRGTKRKQKDHGAHRGHGKQQKNNQTAALVSESEGPALSRKRSESKSETGERKSEKSKDCKGLHKAETSTDHPVAKDGSKKADGKGLSKASDGAAVKDHEGSARKEKSKCDSQRRIGDKRTSETSCTVPSNQTKQPSVADGDKDSGRDVGRAVKDTAKSKWDTSSDSELETNRGHKKSAQSSGDAGRKQENKRHSERRVNRSRSADRDTSSERNSRRRHRSRRRYDDSGTSYSSSYSRYSSSSRSSASRSRSRSSNRRRRRRRSSAYSDTDTDDDYRRSSRSYTRSRSRSSRRRRTRSSSFSYSSRSSSRSYSGRRRRSRTRSRSHRRDSPHRRSSPHWRLRPTHNSNNAPKGKPVSAPTKSPSTDKTLAPADRTASTLNAQTVSQESTSLGAEQRRENQDLADKSEKVVGEDLTSIPTPEEHMRSIPLPNRPETSAAQDHGTCFIGPVLPTGHPLAHTQQIPLPPTEKFQHIGPDDPLVFRSNPPLPPAPTNVSGRPPSPPGDGSVDMEDDIAGDEEPIPQMLDVGALQPAMILPPEQLDQYQALQRQAELHARRHRILEETGVDIADMEEAENVEEVPDEQQELLLQQQQQQQQQQHQQALLGRLLIEQSQQTLLPAAVSAAAPVIHIPQQHLMAAAQSPMQMMTTSSGGHFVQVPMVQGPAGSGGIVNIGGTSFVIPQAGAPIMLAASPAAAAAAAAFARAQDEAEAEFEAQKQMQAAALAAAAASQQHRPTEWVQLVQMPGGQLAVAHAAPAAHPTGPQIVPGGAPTLMRPAGLSVHSMPMHHIGVNPQQHSLLQLSNGSGLISFPTGAMLGGMQMIAQQPQPAPFLLGPNGTLLRLLR